MAARPRVAPVENPLIAKLERIAPLSESERAAIRELCRQNRTVGPGSDIVSEGESPDHIHLILEGWAARYKIVPDGARQITAFLIPGDLCDSQAAVLRQMDHGVTALTAVTVAFIPQTVAEALPLLHPNLVRVLWWSTLVDEAVLRAWIVNLGRRDAYERVAHLICELHARLRKVGLVEDQHFALPLTQEVLADALGLTSVHINRVVQRLRAEKLITLHRGTLTILEGEKLGRAAGFDDAYLRTRRRD